MDEKHNGNGGSEGINLQDIIRDRKLERKLKAEEKRQMDLERIRNMKSTTGMDPLQRFPKEIWQEIFTVLDPEDKWNAYQVHPLFRDLLEKNKVRDILFPQVFKLHQFQQSFDPNYYGVNYTKLRGISTSMRNAVDVWTEQNLSRNVRIHGTAGNHARLSTVQLFYEDHQQVQYIRGLLSSFEGKKKRHFYPRALSVTFPYFFFDNDYPQGGEQRLRDTFTEFKNDITALLELFGGQILHFGFELYRQDPMDDRELIVSLDEIYILLQKWTTLTPNLQWLQLRPYYPQLGEEQEHRMTFSTSVLKEYPFPHLPFLERVTFQYDYIPEQSVTPQLCRLILDANQHVKILNLEGIDDSQFRLLPMDLIRSLPLKRFSVGNENEENDEDLKLSWMSIKPLINLNWKLEAIKLELYDITVSINNLLRFLENFPTLENVSLGILSGVSIGYDEEDAFRYLNLPNLTDLELKISNPAINYGYISNVHFLFSLQFLLNCSKLKTLDWKLWWIDDCQLRNHLKMHEKRGQGNMLDFRAGLRILYDSNIWSVFPSLRTVKVEGWRRANDNIANVDNRCRHEYRREDIDGGMAMTVGKFFKNHWCGQKDNHNIQNCVMIHG